MLFPSVRAPTVHDALFCVFPIIFLLSLLSIHRTIMSNLMQSTGEMANTIDDGQDASQLVFLGSCGMQLTSIIATDKLRQLWSDLKLSATMLRLGDATMDDR